MSEICSACDRQVPDGVTSNMCVNGEYVLLCPVCGLRLRNKLHGLPLETPFSGPMAQAMFLNTVDFMGARAPKWAQRVAKRMRTEREATA